MSVRSIIVLAAASSLLCGCEQNDVGMACPEMVVPQQNQASTDGDVRRTEGSVGVEYNVLFPCDTVVCVATFGHDGGYCSRECDTDDDCPKAFNCHEVTDQGPFAGRTYCVWSECRSDNDCGDPWLMACEAVPELGLVQEVRLCKRRDD